MEKKNVLVVDDSAFMRRYLKQMIESDPSLNVIDTAKNGEEAVWKVKQLKPDVVTLDINMPSMDGLTALTYIMLECPTPTIIISSLTQEGALTTFEALELGAVDFVSKPSGTISLDIEVLTGEIISKIKSALRAKLSPKGPHRIPRKQWQNTTEPKKPSIPRTGPELVVAIGVSTGGPRTLTEILPELPADLPATVLVVQHMPPPFTASFAQRLNGECQMQVKESKQGDPIMPGLIYIAKGGYQLTVTPGPLGNGSLLRLGMGTSDQLFCPSVGMLFNSVARLFGRRAVGVLLTGMGDDGADGMVKIRNAGGITIAESEESAIIFGMPAEAIKRGGAEIVAPANRIAKEIQAAVYRIKSSW